MGNSDTPEVKVDELVVLSKFDGDSTHPDDEVERVTIHNGFVVSHEVVENGEVVGQVENSDIVGKDIGVLFPNETVEGVA